MNKLFLRLFILDIILHTPDLNFYQFSEYTCVRMSTLENLYAKNLSVRLINTKSEEKLKPIHIRVDFQTIDHPRHKIVIKILITKIIVIW